MRRRVLVVTADLAAAGDVRSKLLPLQYWVHIAGRADDALSVLGLQRIGAVLVDPPIADHSMDWLHTRIADRHPRLARHVILMVSSDPSEDVAAFVEATGSDTVSRAASGAQLQAVLSRHFDASGIQG